MRNKKGFCFKWLLSALLLATIFPALAQNESEKGLPFITNYTAKMLGSLNSINWSIIEDNDGMMYFGENKTKTNLWQYDGVRWAVIPCPPASAVIRSLAKDKNGVIYYGGLCDFWYIAI